MHPILEDPYILWYISICHRNPHILRALLIVFKKLREYIKKHDLIDQLYQMYVKYKVTEDILKDIIIYCGYLPNGNTHGINIRASTMVHNKAYSYEEIRNDKFHGLFVTWNNIGEVYKILKGKNGDIYYEIELGYDHTHKAHKVHKDQSHLNINRLMEHIYSEGKVISSQMYDTENFQLKEEYYYDNDQAYTGTHTKWYNNGNLHTIDNYFGGKHNGKQYIFGRNGKLYEYNEYIKDKLICKIIWGNDNIGYSYFSNGKVSKECYYNQHMIKYTCKNKHTKCEVYFDSEGNISKINYNYDKKNNNRLISDQNNSY